jgi:4-hydroxy-tetrahydrodipicolinate synthase
MTPSRASDHPGLDHFPRGVLVPVLTPFRDDLAINEDRFIAHCRWLRDEGADGLAVFGTTSEANSLSVGERVALLDRLLDAGISPRMLLPGTGCCALPDTVALTRHAMNCGCFGVLLLPPFYYKAVTDDGIFASVAETIARVGDDRLRVYLYHIPQMSGVGFSLPLIERLIAAFPGVVVGIKDSSGDWKNTQALLERLPGFEVLPGSETYLLDALRLGGAGCISATANVNVRAIHALVEAWKTPGAATMQEGLRAVRTAIERYPLVAACKVILAAMRGDPGWKTLRPPLRPLAAGAAASLLATLETLGFPPSA